MSVLWKRTSTENIMNILKDYVIKNAITGTEKALKAINPVTINSYWGNLCPDFVHDVTGFTKEPIKEIGWQLWIRDQKKKKKKKVVGKVFQDINI